MAEETYDVWRIFTLPDGKSSMERLRVALEGGRSRLLAGKDVQIAVIPANRSTSWHTGPGRTLIATIAGGGELEMGDGQVLSMKPGTITLIEDLTGQGHMTRNGPEGRVCVFVTLEENAAVE